MISKVNTFYNNNSFFDFTRKVIYFFRSTFKLTIFSNFRSFINIYDSCKIELAQNGRLQIGNRVILSYGVVLSCSNKITIGDNVQIGEYSSLRDATHNYKGEQTIIMNNDDLLGEVEIGNNVWIGRNCLIAAGAKIGNGVVVGANAIVKGVLEDNGVYAGNPIRKIGNR